MPAIAYYNGVFGNPEEMTVPLNDRAMFYGDGCYDATFVISGKPLDFEWHIARFYNSLRLMRIDFKLSEEELASILMECVRRAGEGTYLLYWQSSRGIAPRAHAFPENAEPTLLVTMLPKAMPDTRTPAKFITTEDIRHHRCNIKTLNLYPNVMASQAAKEVGAYEAIFVRDGIVTEGSHTNCCILKNGTLITHEDCELILPGITKRSLIEAAESIGMPIEQRSFTLEEMRSADEIFVTGSSTFLKRCCMLDEEPAGMKDGDSYERLLTAFERRVKAQI